MVGVCVVSEITCQVPRRSTLFENGCDTTVLVVVQLVY